jgi:transcriptional regulator with XRE-family HTH domain
MMTGLRELLAFNIRTRRKGLGLSQAKLAEKIDSAPTYIAMIELKKRFPSPEMLERIAGALEIDPPELFATSSFHSKSLKEEYLALLEDIDTVVKGRIREVEKGG